MVRRKRSMVFACMLGLALHQLAFVARAENHGSAEKIKDHVVADGVVFAAHLAIAPASDSHFTSTALSVGYKKRWAIMAVDFGYESEEIASKFPGDLHGVEFTNRTENSITTIALGARGQFAFLRWPQKNLDLFGQIGIGFRFGRSSRNSMEWGEYASTQTLPEVGIAPGLRYWLHSNCGVSLTAGVELAAGNESNPVTQESTYEISPKFEFQFLTAF